MSPSLAESDGASSKAVDKAMELGVDEVVVEFETLEALDERHRKRELRRAAARQDTSRQQQQQQQHDRDARGSNGSVQDDPAAAAAAANDGSSSTLPSIEYPLREVLVKLPRVKEPIAVNPIVVLIGVACLWSLVIWCTVDPTGALTAIEPWRTHIAESSSWLFQGTKALTFAFILYLVYAYGHLHMGRTDEKPEFSTLSYCATIFTAGSGVALLTCSVQQPLFISQGSFYSEARYRTQDELDMIAINLTVVNWGVAAWSRYTFVAVAVSLAAHRFRLPLTFRSCFYPILGAYTWGWIGDVIDGLSAVATGMSVLLNLGLATVQIFNGVMHMGWIDPHATAAHVEAISTTTVWMVVLLSVASVVFGLHGGTTILSGIALAVASVLLCLVFLMDHTTFLLNLQIQEVGYYMQSGMFQLNFWTDAFGQLADGAGRAVDDKGAEPWWMSTWLDVAQAWCITISIPVGLVIGRLSRGRKLWEIVVYSMVAPVGYSLVWFCVWGGIGIRQARQSLELQNLGQRYFNGSDHFLADGSSFCYDVPQDDVVVDGTVVFTNHLRGVTPVCLPNPEDPYSAIYDVLHSFGFPDSFRGASDAGEASGLCRFLVFLFILACVLFFATTSDYTSIALEHLSSNGRAMNQKGGCRIFWILSLGTLTTILMIFGGTVAVSAVQSAIFVIAVPFTILLCYVFHSITLFCQVADSLPVDQDVEYRRQDIQPEFATPVVGGVFNCLEYAASFGKVDTARVALSMHTPSNIEVKEFVKGLFVPFVSLYQVLSVAYPRNVLTNATVSLLYAVGFVGWVGLLATSRSHAWVGFALCSFMLAYVRCKFRSVHNIRSNQVGDLISSAFLWPQVLMQMRQHQNQLALDAAVAEPIDTTAI